MGTLEVTFDAARGQFCFTAEGELESTEFRRTMEAWIAASGVAEFEHDRLWDLRAYSGTVTHEDVRHLGRLLRDAGANMPRGRTVFVSTDAGFGLWARTMQLELPLRPMTTVASMEVAEMLLGTPPATAARRSGSAI